MGVQLVAINSNDDKAYPEDSYPKMVKRAKEKGFNFPYVRDPGQKAAEAYGAVCTPHVFAFDMDRKLRYRGRIDDSKGPFGRQEQRPEERPRRHGRRERREGPGHEALRLQHQVDGALTRTAYCFSVAPGGSNSAQSSPSVD